MFREDKPYCADCFGELFSKRCTACAKPITGKNCIEQPLCASLTDMIDVVNVPSFIVTSDSKGPCPTNAEEHLQLVIDG